MPDYRRVAFGILERIERDGTTGLVAVHSPDGEEHGRLMVARGRLCFAAAAQGHVRIGEMLAAEDGAVSALLETLALQARQRGKRLCEVILEQGAVDVQRLRDALLRQATMALLAIGQGLADAEPVLDVAPARDDYDPRLTFTSLDVFLAISRSLDTAPPDAAAEIFDRWSADGRRAAVLFLHGPEPHSPALPLAARGLPASSLAEVVGVAREAGRICGRSAFPLAWVEPRLRLPTPGTTVWVCATADNRFLLLRCLDPADAERFVGNVFGEG